MRGLILLVSLMAFGSIAAARELTPAEKRILPFGADVSACQSADVLDDMSSRFAQKEREFWNSSLTIVQYDRIQPLAWRPWGLETVPRLFCTATATISDGRRHTVNYSVRERLGFAGFGEGVEFCVVGFDRNLAYSPACTIARP